MTFKPTATYLGDIAQLIDVDVRTLRSILEPLKDKIKAETSFDLENFRGNKKLPPKLAEYIIRLIK